MSQNHERAPETLGEKITASTPAMLVLTLGAALGTIFAVCAGFYTLYRLFGFISNTLGI